MKRLNKLSIINILFLFIYFILILLNSLRVISYNKIFNLVYLIFLFIITFLFSYKEHKVGIGKKENEKKVIYYLVFILLIYFLSGIIFGLAHITDPSNMTELLFSIPYIVMGIIFALIYSRTNNIFTTITFHLCHNLILLIIQFL